jgi:hypothetical protein
MKSNPFTLAILGLATMVAMSCKSRAFNSESDANDSEVAKGTSSLLFVSASGGANAECLYVGRMSEDLKILWPLHVAQDRTSKAKLGPVLNTEILKHQEAGACTGGGCLENESLNLSGQGAALVQGFMKAYILGSVAGILIATGAVLGDGVIEDGEMKGVINTISSTLFMTSALVLTKAGSSNGSSGTPSGGSSKGSNDEKMSLTADEPKQLKVEGREIPLAEMSLASLCSQTGNARSKLSKHPHQNLTRVEARIYDAVTEQWGARDMDASADSSMKCQDVLTEQDFCSAAAVL